MYYTGIDLHKKTSYITTIDENGKIIAKGNMHNLEEAILDYFAKLEQETKIVIESMDFPQKSGHGQAQFLRSSCS